MDKLGIENCKTRIMKLIDRDRRFKNSECKSADKARSEALSLLKDTIKNKPDGLWFSKAILYVDISIKTALHFAAVSDLRTNEAIQIAEKQLDAFEPDETVEYGIIFDKRKEFCKELAAVGYFDLAISIMKSYSVKPWMLAGLIQIALVKVNEHESESARIIFNALLDMKKLDSDYDYECAASELSNSLVDLFLLYQKN